MNHGWSLRWLRAALLVLSLPVIAAMAKAQPEDSFRFSGVERVVAIADIHGAYEAFVSLLQGTKLVDETLRWSGEQSHLVIVGDVLDRGDRSREVLDLLMRLEQEAARAGGAVHMVLGNHEIMNLSGELAYVTREEFTAYADLEQNGMRRPAQQRFSAQVPGLSNLALRSAFGRQYPRGYFGHRAAFAPDGLYGQWLLSKPVVLVINDSAFIHAGLSARLSGETAAQINTSVMPALRNYLDAMQTLQQANVLFPETDFNRHADVVRRYLVNGRQRADPEIQRAADIILNSAQSDPFSSDSPVWYRGMTQCNDVLEQDHLQVLRESLKVERLIIGHTPTADHRVQQRFDNALLLADTGMLKDYYGGQPAAVILENAELQVFYAETATLQQAVPMPRLVGNRPVNVDDDALADMLAAASITGQSNNADGTQLLDLRIDNVALTTIFSPAIETPEGSFIAELAAYRLDRALGMDLLPVAVYREIDGQAGAIYLDQGSSLANTASTSNDAAWCPAQDQLALMQVFDFLLNEHDRAASERYSTNGNGKLVLLHQKAVLDTRVPPALPADNVLARSTVFKDKLDTLTLVQIETQLGEVLDGDRRDALFARIQQLLNSME